MRRACLRALPGQRLRFAPDPPGRRPSYSRSVGAAPSAHGTGPLAGLRVVWDLPGLSAADRALCEDLLTKIVADALREALGAARAGQGQPAAPDGPA